MRHKSGRVFVAVVLLLLASTALAQKKTGLIKGTVDAEALVVFAQSMGIEFTESVYRGVKLLNAAAYGRGEKHFEMVPVVEGMPSAAMAMP